MKTVWQDCMKPKGRIKLGTKEELFWQCSGSWSISRTSSHLLVHSFLWLMLVLYLLTSLRKVVRFCFDVHFTQEPQICVFVFFSPRWVWIGEIYAHQLPVPDGPVLQGVPRPFPAHQEDRAGKIPQTYTKSVCLSLPLLSRLVCFTLSPPLGKMFIHTHTHTYRYTSRPCPWLTALQESAHTHWIYTQTCAHTHT